MSTTGDEKHLSATNALYVIAVEEPKLHIQEEETGDDGDSEEDDGETPQKGETRTDRWKMSTARAAVARRTRRKK